MRSAKNRIIAKDGSGSIQLTPEEPEDMWHAYNLIAPGDKVFATAKRKVKTESLSGDSSSKAVVVRLTIKVRSTDFDPQAGELHVAGQVCEENEYVGLGQFHTLDLELNRAFTLEKEEGWDSVALQTLREAVDTDKKAGLWAVVMQEGMANICSVTDYQTILRQKVEVSIPRKRIGATSELEKSTNRFFETLLATLLRQIDVNNSSTPILLASPGFTAGIFKDFMKKNALATNNKALLALQQNVVVERASSGHVHALKDVLASSGVQKRLSNTKYARETQLMDKFFELLRKDDGRAWYGPREVEQAVEKGAVGRGGGVLLITDTLFRAQDVAIRRRWVSLVDQVSKVEGGEVRILSSMHESGKRLESLGNIAAILTFPIEDLDDGEEEDEAIAQNVNELQI